MVGSRVALYIKPHRIIKVGMILFNKLRPLHLSVVGFAVLTFILTGYCKLSFIDKGLRDGEYRAI